MKYTRIETIIDFPLDSTKIYISEKQLFIEVGGHKSYLAYIYSEDNSDFSKEETTPSNKGKTYPETYIKIKHNETELDRLVELRDLIDNFIFEQTDANDALRKKYLKATE